MAPRFDGFALLRSLVEALADEPIELVVALGDDPALLGDVPGSARVHRWVPLAVALPHCSVLVHHGGAGSSLAAAHAGVGQVVLPQGADQFMNADSLVARGCALRADPQPDAVRRAVRDVLAGGLDGPVAAVRDEIASMAPPAAVAPDLVAAFSGA